jgi:hypothetical protein
MSGSRHQSEEEMDRTRALAGYVALVAIAAFGAWILVSFVVGRFPAPAAGAADATKLGFFLIQVGVALAVFAALVGFVVQIVDVMFPVTPPSTNRLLGIDVGKLVDALAKLIVLPGGMGLALVIFGVILAFPSALVTS